MKKIFITIFLLSFFNSVCQISSKNNYEEAIKFTDNKNYEKALYSINEALKFDKLNRDYLLQKIKILFFESNCFSGLNLLFKLIKKEKKVDDVTVSYLCDLYDCLNESTEASRVLTNYVDKKKFDSNEIIITLAQRYFATKNYEKTIYYYKEYLKLNPKDVKAIIDVSRIIFSSRGSESGINNLKRELEKNLNNIELLTCLSNFYYEIQEYQKSIDIENQIIKLDNNNYTQIATRAMLYEKINNLEKAYEDNKTIISLLKCNTDSYIKVLQYEYENKLFEDVVKHSLELIECNKSYENLIVDALYTSLFFCGNFEKGKIYLEKNLNINSNNFNSFYLKSLILFKDKEYENVLKYLNLAKNSKDIDLSSSNNINLLEFGYYLLVEDYEGFVSYCNSIKIKSLQNNLNFEIVEGKMTDKTELKTDFIKTTGVIKTTLIIPSNVFKMLANKYNLKFEIYTIVK